MATRVGNALFAILVSAILARLLDPERLGYYFLVLSVVNICSILIGGGQAQAAIRLIAEADALGQFGRARKSAIMTLSGVAVIAVLFSTLYYLFLGDWLFSQFFDSPAVLGLTGLVAVWIVVVGLKVQVAHIFRGMHAVRLAAVFNGLVSTLLTLVLLLFLYFRPTAPELVEVVVCSVVGAFLTLLIALVVLRAGLSKLKGEGSVRLAEIAAISWPVFLTGLLIMSVTYGDMILLGYLFDDRDVAIYGVALRVKAIFLLHLYALGMVLSPLIARLFAQNEQLKLEKIMRLVATIAFVPLALIMLVMVFFGDTLIAWIFGEVYRESYWILIIYMGSLFVAAAMGSGQQLILMSGHESKLLPIRLIGSLFAILGALLVAPRMGIVGVALAFSLSTAGVSVAMTLAARKLTGITCYIYSPSFFADAQNRQTLLQELRAALREAMTRRRGSGPVIPNEE